MWRFDYKWTGRFRLEITKNSNQFRVNLYLSSRILAFRTETGGASIRMTPRPKSTCRHRSESISARLKPPPRLAEKSSMLLLRFSATPLERQVYGHGVESSLQTAILPVASLNWLNWLNSALASPPTDRRVSGFCISICPLPNPLWGDIAKLHLIDFSYPWISTSGSMVESLVPYRFYSHNIGNDAAEASLIIGEASLSKKAKRVASLPRNFSSSSAPRLRPLADSFAPVYGRRRDAPRNVKSASNPRLEVLGSGTAAPR